MSYRVVVWGPGNVGGPAIRSVVANPALELVGLIVHSPEKDGVDAGELAGIPATGVLATRDVSAALGESPDTLFYGVNSDFRPLESIGECCDALRAGINVVTAGMYGLLHPKSAAAAARLVKAIPAVCASPAGLLSAAELPLVVGRGLIV